jgi:nickel-type superoxide dismutase maturation protease
MRSWRLAALLAAVPAIAALRGLDVVEVRGRSMAPTLLPGDRLLVMRAPPRAGDVVVAADPRDGRHELVKRVAAVGPDGVTLRGDNPVASTDARAFGDVSVDEVRWRAFARYWPLARAGRIPTAPALLDVLEEGGEPSCSFPDALIAGTR